MITYYEKKDFKELPDYFWTLYNQWNKYAITVSYGYPMILCTVGICDKDNKDECNEMYKKLWDDKEELLKNHLYAPLYGLDGYIEDKWIFVQCDVGYPEPPEQNINPDFESNKHVEYALFHLASQNYIYNSDEGGMGFNGNEPFLMHDNDWHGYFGEDRFEDEEGLYLFTNDGTYPIEEFEVHEYQCSFVGTKDVEEPKRVEKNPEDIKHEMILMNQNSSRFTISAEREIIKMMKDERSFEEIDKEMDDLLSDIIY